MRAADMFMRQRGYDTRRRADAAMMPRRALMPAASALTLLRRERC